jgi:hypothetical protein
MQGHATVDAHDIGQRPIWSVLTPSPACNPRHSLKADICRNTLPVLPFSFHPRLLRPFVVGLLQSPGTVVPGRFNSGGEG